MKERVERTALLKYTSQPQDNKSSFVTIRGFLREVAGQDPAIIEVDAGQPLPSYEHIKDAIRAVGGEITIPRVTVDISGMTHMWALGVVNACIESGLEVQIVYTEAAEYFPLRRHADGLLKAWKGKDYDKAEMYLQSAALMAVHVLPDFAGNFRPGRPTCLIVFAGYEPNRIEGLIDSYAPGALVVLYGKSPRREHLWRMRLSQKLHEEMFISWPHREDVCSTLKPDESVAKLEEIFSVIGAEYDVAVSPHCSKMQGIAAYMFWRRHPEIQLLFTSPAKFNPKQYSVGERETYIYELSRSLALCHVMPFRQACKIVGGGGAMTGAEKSASGAGHTRPVGADVGPRGPLGAVGRKVQP
jgi:hypothetical protein